MPNARTCPSRPSTARDLIVPLRVAIELRGRSRRRPDPLRHAVVGADGQTGGVVSDLWVDRAESHDPLLSKSSARRRRKRVLLPMPFANVDSRTGAIKVQAILGGQFADVPGDSPTRPGDHARGRQDHGLLRRAARSTPPPNARSRCYERRSTSRNCSRSGHPAGRARALARPAANGSALARRAFRVRRRRGLFRCPDALRLRVGRLRGRRSATARFRAAKTLLAACAAHRAAVAARVAYGRTTLYIVTTRRLVMQIGIALPMTFNLPFSQIDCGRAARLTRRDRRYSGADWPEATHRLPACCGRTRGRCA